jgi:hypothetical protein
LGNQLFKKTIKLTERMKKKCDSAEKGTLEKIPMWLLMFFVKIVIFLKGDCRASGWDIFV